jgi:hypothetical protein
MHIPGGAGDSAGVLRMQPSKKPSEILIDWGRIVRYVRKPEQGHEYNYDKVLKVFKHPIKTK